VDQHGLQKMFGEAFVPVASDLIRHTAKRDAPGLIELWPLSPAPNYEHDELPWRPEPVDSPSEDSARETLAREIARQIKNWIDTKQPVSIRGALGETTRPMQPKDILILVRKRTGAFFNAVIRNLKLQGVPVAGADRLVLSDSIAVQDLMSIARFCCLPGDDLALAEVLKGPLFGISEEEDGRSNLRLLYQRLSMEVADPIEAFLARALAHQRNDAPSLQHFVQSFLSDTGQLKRELDGRHNEVRVMTVYGAKGLEAPVVILPDTSQKPDGKTVLDNGMLSLEGFGFDCGFARPGRTAETPEALRQIKAAREEKLYQEYMRLFYVALTRAETRLLICGYFSGNKPREGAAQKAVEGCWHDWAQKAITGLGAREIETPFSSEDYKGYAYGAPPVQVTETADVGQDALTVIPAWAAGAVPPRPAKLGPRHVTPSTLLAENAGLEPAARSPLSQSPDRFLRGNLIHKLLELLPDVPTQKRDAAMARFLSGHDGLEDALRDDISATVNRVLNKWRHIAKWRAQLFLAERLSARFYGQNGLR